MPSASGLAVGRILRPWGIQGAVVVEPMTHDVRRFERLDHVRLEGDAERRTLRTLHIDRRGRPIVALAGVATMDQAEGLRGLSLLVDDDEAERPEGEAYFNHELVGAEVSTRDGRSLGRVEEVLEMPGVNILVVRSPEGEVLLPAARPILVEVDVAGQRIVVDPPDGLIDLNRIGAGRAV